MAYSSNRHYRVVQRDKELETETEKLNKETFMQLTIVSMIVYTTSVLLSLALGYLIGKNE